MRLNARESPTLVERGSPYSKVIVVVGVGVGVGVVGVGVVVVDVVAVVAVDAASVAARLAVADHHWFFSIAC